MLTNFVRLIRKFMRSLSFKLSFYAALIMLMALLAFSYQSISAQENNLVHRKVRGAIKDSEVVKAAIWNGMMTQDSKVIREIVETIGTQGGFEEINLYDAEGRLNYTSSRGNRGKRADPAKHPLLADLKTNESIRYRMSDNGDAVRVVNPILNTKSCSTAQCHAHPETERILGALEVELTLASVKDEIFHSKRNTIVFALFLFVLVSSVSGLGVVLLVNPHIRKLQENAAKMGKGEYRPEGRAGGSDEIAELERSFDRMSWQINERTRQLDASRKMYKSLFEDVPCYLTVVSKNYRIVRANRAFTNQFGEQVGKHCFTGYKGLESRCGNCPVERTFRDGVSHQSEEVWSVEGRNVYVIVKTSPILDENGRVVEVLEMSVDITRLKTLQFELEKKQKDFQNLFENVPCYLTVVDQEFTIIQTNKQFDAGFGAKIGKKCYEIYKKSEHKCDNCPVEKTFQDGLTHTSEEVWRNNGDEIYLIVYTAPITNEQGEIKAVMEMSTNITEIKRLQGELAILGETIAGMSHTIKNILTGLQGGVYIVDSGLARGKGERIRTGWDMVKNNVQKVSDLVKGILYASKEREPEYKDCDPGAILAEICDLYEERAKADGIELVRAFDDELGLCRLDPAGIHSALSNLMSNAIAACRTLEGNSGRRITVGGCLEEGRLFMQVGDNGKGMPEEVKEKLFHKFYSTKGAKGTGLGLVITRKVVQEHGGNIHVESAPGRGTVFTIDIPVTPPEEKDVLKEAV